MREFSPYCGSNCINLRPCNCGSPPEFPPCCPPPCQQYPSQMNNLLPFIGGLIIGNIIARR